MKLRQRLHTRQLDSRAVPDAGRESNQLPNPPRASHCRICKAPHREAHVMHLSSTAVVTVVVSAAIAAASLEPRELKVLEGFTASIVKLLKVKNKHKHKHKHKRKHEYKHKRRHTDTQTHRHTDTQTHRHTERHRRRRRRRQTETHTHTHLSCSCIVDLDTHR